MLREPRARTVNPRLSYLSASPRLIPTRTDDSPASGSRRRSCVSAAAPRRLAPLTNLDSAEGGSYRPARAGRSGPTELIECGPIRSVTKAVILRIQSYSRRRSAHHDLRRPGTRSRQAA